MGTAQSDDLLIVEAHTAKNITQVLVSLGGIWETSIRCACCDILIFSAWPVWNNWTLHLLDSDDSAENPEIGVADPWELFYDKCQQLTANESEGYLRFTGSKKSRAATSPALAP